ncbi:sodium:solute symporter [Treponema sp.]|uniref:sodium:solute symporter family transporter n=1 Tax=Treponema sp. TaxID=166 RepID=UPI0025CE6477|nr:sodium:solute symporter [Treponema sp.]MCR5218677.1 sodium:solute symporter [Treponema sp.]
MFVKLALLLVFFAVFIFVGIKCRSMSKNVSGYVLGGRSVGPWLTAFAYGTSYFSAVIFVGYAGQFGWTFGVASTWIGLGNAFIGSLMAWAILGRRTRIMTQHLNSKTMSEFFGKRYGSPALKVASSAITFLFLIPYTASLFNGLSRLFRMAFSVDYALCVIVMAVLTAVYVIAGGYMATAVNDFIQGIVMLAGIVAVILAVLAKNGGFMASLAAMSEIQSPVMKGAYVSFFGPDPLYLMIVVLLTSLGTWGLPQMVGKFYAIKNEESIKIGTVISTFFALVVAGGCYFLGGFGRLFSTPEAVAAGGFDSIVPSMLSGLGDLLIAVVLILVLSASMSTLSSLVLTSSSTLTLDFINSFRRKKSSEKTDMLTMRFFVAVFIVISAVIAIVQAKSRVTFIAQLMGISWGALSGAFLAPFMYGLYWKKVSRLSVAASFAFSVIVMVCQLCISLKLFTVSGPVSGFIFKNSLYSGVFCMLSGLVIVPLVSFFTKKSVPSDADAMFSCYDARVLVPAKDVLTDSEGQA